MEGGRVSHRWCMCVVSLGYGGLGIDRDGGGAWYAYGTKLWGLVGMSVDAGALPECEKIL